jgi:late competence protein required for DNA uptake (superfamily II DNA/RNA helicase)
MFFYANLNLSKEKDEISKEILKCSLNGKKRIDVISVFYNSSDLLLETIIAYANEKKNILYITNENERSIDIVYFVSKFSNLGKYVYSPQANYSSVNEYLHICNHENALKLQEKFDLVIYNDIRSFPKYNKQQIKKLLLKMCKTEGIAIAYSVENVLSEGTTIILPLKDNKIPIIEPRIITTRINLSMDIPLVVYEYLNWSIISNRKVIIFTPDEEKATAVFEYLSNFKEKLSENIFLFISKKSDADIPIKFMDKDKGIIVTNDFEESYLEFHAVDVMVYFADNIKFNHKQLLYLSSKVGRYENIQRGEAIFLANVETVQMDKAKSTARKFNKKAWEKGLLNL